MWAKVNGNYERINSGSLTEAWDFLAGIPGKYYSHADVSTVNNNAATMWGLINDAMNANNVAAFGTAGGPNPYNLVPSHAYSVLSTFDFVDSSAVHHKLLRIRNPWGRDVYNSSLTWADNSTASWNLEAMNSLPFKHDL